MNRRPFGITLVGAFLLVAAGILVVSCSTLLHPGTSWDLVWILKPHVHEQLLLHRAWAAPGFLLLAIVTSVAAVGWLQLRPWAWWLVLVVLVANGVGDGVRAFTIDPLGGIVGLWLVASLIFYMTRGWVRNMFHIAHGIR